MAPPHLLKKSSWNAHSSRNGRREPSGNLARETDEYENEELYNDSVYSVTEHSPPPKQRNHSDKKLEKLVEDMVDAQRTRHRTRKQAVHKSYAQTKSELQTRITSLFEAHKEKAAHVHDAQWARLRDLIREKRDIEAQMTTKQNQVRNAYLSHCEALELALKRRVRDLR